MKTDLNEKIDRFVKSTQRNKVTILMAGLILLLLGNIFNIALDWLRKYFGDYNVAIGIVIVAIPAIIALWVSHILNEKKKGELMVRPTSEPLKERYKGLIISVSLVGNPDNKGEHEKNIKDIKTKIDSVNLEDNEAIKELYKVRSVGQTFRAIFHHAGELEVLWLLCSEEAANGGEFDLVKHFVKKVGGETIKVILVRLEDRNKIESIHKSVNEIYKGLDEMRLKEKEVIADITGGTSIMTSAIILACLSPDRDIECVEQGNQTLIKIDENISEISFKS